VANSVVFSHGFVCLGQCHIWLCWYILASVWFIYSRMCDTLWNFSWPMDIFICYHITTYENRFNCGILPRVCKWRFKHSSGTETTLFCPWVIELTHLSAASVLQPIFSISSSSRVIRKLNFSCTGVQHLKCSQKRNTIKAFTDI